MSDEQACEKQLSADFPTSLRLLTAEDYKRVFNNNPLKIVCPPYTLLAVPNLKDCSRIGLIVAKKNVRNAVDRNRIKRLARESFRLNQHQIPTYDIVLLARCGSSQLPNKVLFGHLEQLWIRLQKRSSK
ncbi:ribonuclease P protein component [Kangiella koreensis]|uniref:Ribonuclease P protein component n=1 Tax=Kangiella koreensis (strain DSM 16069 / JCM 12317 / KCTC 12182 / SW-125) TaxID=523791 RepID=C7RAG0_KANKD|nr:ribonuclease P protein component [Kangiella koreensis]ACV28054.1 ribonuclease P protein component [Kangiella koreensis DSM 16069]